MSNSIFCDICHTEKTIFFFSNGWICNNATCYSSCYAEVYSKLKHAAYKYKQHKLYIYGQK